MSLGPRFQIEYVVGESAGLTGFELTDTLTGSTKIRFRELWAEELAKSILRREATMPWDEIVSYDFFLSPISVASVEVFPLGADGEQIRFANGYTSPMVIVAHDYDEQVIIARVEQWFRDMGREPLLRQPALVAENDRKLTETALTPIRPGVRTRNSLLASKFAA